MRFWLSVPFIRRTRIGISVSDSELARAFAQKPLTVAEQEQRAAKDAEIEAWAQDAAKRWTPFVNWFIVISFTAFVIGMIVWGQYMASHIVP